MRKILSRLEGWRSIVLIAYMWVILMAYAVVYINESSLKSHFYALSFAEVLLFILMYICPKLLKHAEGLLIRNDNSKNSSASLLFTWLIIFGVLFTVYAAFYPGGFSPDSINQYSQAIGAKNYNDWHPVLHTLFAFTLPLKLSGGWAGSIVLFQILVFSFALTYTLKTLREYGNSGYVKAVMLYNLVNPITLGILMFPWKDITFAAFSMISMNFALRIYYSKGEWLRSLQHKILLALILSASTIIRHNAVLFTLPLLIAVMLCVKRLQKIFILVSFCLIIFFIRSPLYKYLEVSPAALRVQETTSLPMTIIGDAMMKNPETIDQDIIDFAYRVAPKEKWQENHRPGSFFSVRYSGIDHYAIENEGAVKILGMMFRCFMKYPIDSLKSFLTVTDVVFGIAGYVDWYFIPLVQEDTLNKAYNVYGLGNVHEEDSLWVKMLRMPCIAYFRLCRIFLKHVFFHIGVPMLLVLVLLLAKLDFTRTSDLKKLCFILPLFVYNFGTMLLIGGSGFRYFYYSFLIVPQIILLLLSDKSNNAGSCDML